MVLCYDDNVRSSGATDDEVGIMTNLGDYNLRYQFIFLAGSLVMKNRIKQNDQTFWLHHQLKQSLYIQLFRWSFP